MTRPIVFVDCETTGLVPFGGEHRAWEIAVVHENDAERVWQVRLDAEVLARATPQAMAIGGYRERFRRELARPEAEVAREVADALEASVLAGIHQWFDAGFLSALLERHSHAPGWGYDLLDVVAYGAGAIGADLPMRSGAIASALGVSCDPTERHTALGDARYARRIYEAARRARCVHRAEV